MDTTTMNDSTMNDSTIAELLRQFAVERFYTREAAMLDERRFEDWLELFADDVTYFMPIRRTRLAKETHLEFTRPGEMAFFDDDKILLEARVTKLRTGRAWAEDPPSRTRRIVTNIDVRDDDGTELRVCSNFLLYRTRLESEEDTWIGSRDDTLRRVGSAQGFVIAARTIRLEQTVLLARNLSNFF